MPVMKTFSDMHCCAMANTEEECSASRMRLASADRRLTQCLAQEIVARVRFNGHKGIEMSPLQFGL